FHLAKAHSGSLTIQLIPDCASVGKNVTLSVSGINGNLNSFTWYLGEPSASNQIINYIVSITPPSAPGPKNFSDAIGLPNGSLLITNLKTEYSNTYTVQVQASTPGQASAELTVESKWSLRNYFLDHIKSYSIYAVDITVSVFSYKGYFICDSGGLTPGQIAGIVIGVLVGVALIAAAAYFICKHLNSREVSDSIWEKSLTLQESSRTNHDLCFNNEPNESLAQPEHNLSPPLMLKMIGIREVRWWGGDVTGGGGGGE
uniref:Immunoglobulin domain-containing protein n=1 Tax=Xenopus tropicalis TaxID=8364 RepID=A0A6I8SHD7_XENTR